MNILTVIALHNDDCIRAERLIDQIFALNRKEQKGHALLIYAPSAPQENRDKVRISAEVTFKSVTILPTQFTKETVNQVDFIGGTLLQAASFISRTYRCPWLWLEPDCLPLKHNWMEQLSAAYEEQPMRYLAGHLKYGEAFAISRIGIYPPDAIKDFNESINRKIGFEFYVVGMSTKCRLFQTVKIESVDDAHLIRLDAVLAHSDKKAVMVDKIVKDNQESESIPKAIVESVGKSLFPEPKRRGRPPFKTPPPNAADFEKRFVSNHEIPNPPTVKPLVTC